MSLEHLDILTTGTEVAGELASRRRNWSRLYLALSGALVSGAFALRARELIGDAVFDVLNAAPFLLPACLPMIAAAGTLRRRPRNWLRAAGFAGVGLGTVSFIVALMVPSTWIPVSLERVALAAAAMIGAGALALAGSSVRSTG